MLEASLRIEGLDRVVANLERLQPIAREKAMRGAMFKAMRPVLLAIQATTPRRSGALRLAMARVYLRPKQGLTDGLAARVAVAPKTKNRQALALANFSYARTRRLRGVYWGHYVEFGTRRGIKPGRFMQRALAANAQPVIDIFAGDIDAQIRRQLK
ncbi:MAG TPA: HK97 gp10 family phage protein [Dehalococcoidia bacterium]|nr:HK97 gp10 family phage protein [Dehalococcoidia bacterium]